MLCWVVVCSLKPGLKCLAFTTIGGGNVACGACAGCSDLLKSTLAKVDGGVEDDVKRFVKELLVARAQSMWAT